MQRTRQIFTGTILLLILLGAGEAQASITPVISASRCTSSAETCAPPLAIFFHARNTTCTTSECDNTPMAENEAFHALSYEWGFGDSAAASQTWSASGQSRDVEYGPLAIHVFEKPGIYTVQLTVRSGSETASQTVQIHVDDPEVVWSNSTRCVSNDSDFTGCPDGAERVQSSSYNAAVSSAFSSGVRRVLFKGGDTFRQTSSVSLPGNNGMPGLVGGFNTADEGRPLIDGRGSGGDFVSANGPYSDWRFHDLRVKVDTSQGHVMQRVGSSSNVLNNFLFYKFEQEDGYNGIVDAHEQAGSGYGDNGLFVVDSTLESNFASSGYAFFGATKGGGLVGSTFGGGSGRTHLIVRVQPRYRDLLIAHNEFVCCADSALTIRGHTNGNTSDFSVVRGNVFRSGSGDSVEHKPEFTSATFMQDGIFEDNYFESKRLYWMARRVTARNNVMLGGNISPSTNNGCSMPSGWVEDSYIYNNSGYGTKNHNSFVFIENDGSGCRSTMGRRWVVRNNLYWHPSSGTVYGVDGGYDTSGAVVSNNYDRTGSTGTSPISSSPFASSPPSANRNDWKLLGSGASPLIDSGFDVGAIALRDLLGNLRPVGSNYDVGAVEFGGTSSPPPPPPPAAALEPPLLLD